MFCAFKLRFDDHLSCLVSESNSSGSLNSCQAFREINISAKWNLASLARRINIKTIVPDQDPGIPIMKLARLLELRVDNEFSDFVNVTPLPVDLHGGKPFGEIMRQLKPRFYSNFASLVNEGPATTDSNRSIAFRKVIHEPKSRRYDDLARLVNKTGSVVKPDPI